MNGKAERISEVPVLEQITDSTNILVEDNGSTHRLPVRDFVDISNPNRHSRYFTITDDGEISLKPCYRGAISAKYAAFTDAISDNGVENVGSKNSELPKDLVIPEEVGETAVFKLADGIFAYNDAIESITIPSFITEIPTYFARHAMNLTEVNGTENIKVINSCGFYGTKIRKAIFPNLETLAVGDDGDGGHFAGCFYLVSADLGKVTTIPYHAFYKAARLNAIHNTNDVTVVGDAAFCKTVGLINVNFIPKLTRIDDRGFASSRINYDWWGLKNCTFGDYATTMQNQIKGNWWEGCTYTPCKTPLLSVFDQSHPEWEDEPADNCGTTIHGACGVVSAAMIYSALANKKLSSPVKFVDLVRSKNPDLLNTDVNGADITKYIEWFRTVGLVASKYTYEGTTNGKKNLQIMYDALADKNNPALVFLVLDGVFTTVDGSHGVVAYGVNELGELLIQDPASDETGYFNNYDDIDHRTYETSVCFRYSVPVQNVTGNMGLASGFLIVTKY